MNTNMFLSSHIVELNKFLSFVSSEKVCNSKGSKKRRERQTTYLLSLPHKKWSKLNFYVWIVPINLSTTAKMCWTNYQHVSQHRNRIIRFRNEFSHSKNAIDLKISKQKLLILLNVYRLINILYFTTDILSINGTLMYSPCAANSRLCYAWVIPSAFRLINAFISH